MTEDSDVGLTLAIPLECAQGFEWSLKDAGRGSDKRGDDEAGGAVAKGRVSHMSHQVCSRCRKPARIPTHQFVKFDTVVQYLCGDCWSGFRGWFHAAERVKRVKLDETPAQEPANPVNGTTPPSSHAA